MMRKESSSSSEDIFRQCVPSSSIPEMRAMLTDPNTQSIKDYLFPRLSSYNPTIHELVDHQIRKNSRHVGRDYKTLLKTLLRKKQLTEENFREFKIELEKKRKADSERDRGINSYLNEDSFDEK